MNPKRVVTMWLLYRRLKLRRIIRRFWIHPINQTREQTGIFHTIFEELQQDGNKFFNFFWMSVVSFDELHERLKTIIQHRNTKMRNSIPSEERLALALRYLASGCTFTDLHYTFRIGISSARKIVKEVCQTIWSVMKDECIPQLTTETFESIASHFEKNVNFPHCLGAVDGKHIRVNCPPNSRSMFFNYKHYFSVVLMAVCDANYHFVYVTVGSFGKDCDSSIFKQSNLWNLITTNSLQIPDEECLPGTDSPKIPFNFVSDEAFGLHRHLLRPYGGTHLTLQKRIFNHRLYRARRYIECAFGILTNKWRIFHRPLNVTTDFAVDIIKACIFLHNFVRYRDGYLPEETTTITGLEDLPGKVTARGGLQANIRNVLSNYFLTNIGAVAWQMSKI